MNATTINKNKTKCESCKRTIAKNTVPLQCNKCNNYFHKKCTDIKTESNCWVCKACLCTDLPFFSLDNNKLLLTLKDIDVSDNDYLNLLPSFSIKSLLEKLPGDISIQTGEFIYEKISSKYYTPIEFLEAKLPKNFFSVFHVNIVSLQKHIDDLKELLRLLNHPFDIIGISETKLKNGLEPIIDLELEGYKLEETSTESHFGGVALYIKNSFTYHNRNDLSISAKDIGETIFVEIDQPQSKNIIIGCFYRHHTELNIFNDTILKKILKKLSKNKQKTCIFLGDFNANLLALEDHEDTENFYEMLSSLSFQPLILQPSRVTPRSSTLIDNIFINELGVCSTGGNITTSISDHFPQFSFLDICDAGHKEIKKQKGRSYKNFNIDEFKNEFLNTSWPDLFQNKSSEESFNLFYKKTEKLLDEMAPIRTIAKNQVKTDKKPWITSGLLKSMHSRDHLHKLALKEKNPHKKDVLFKKFKMKRNIIITLLRKSKHDYYSRFFADNKSDIKETWKGINKIITKNKKNHSTPNSMNKGGILINDKKEIANEFNEFFSSIGKKIDEKIPKSKKSFQDYLIEPNTQQFVLSPVNSNEVTCIINTMKLSKGCGPTSIPTKLLKDLHLIFSPVIAILINKSFTDGTFPELLKVANITPIYKKKERNKFGNYRPISLLSNISKIYERAFHTRLYEFFETSDLLYRFQFGFRKKHSTDHTLLNIMENIKNKMDTKTFSCGIFVDLEKAFDTVNHTILLKKLEYYGITASAKFWLTDYLSARKQRVVIENEMSSYSFVSCGVPQGSILGPLLFLIYINDMHKATKHSILYHFADDTNLLYSNKDCNLMRKNVNEDLKLIFEWLCANRLSVNTDKTEFILFKPPRKIFNSRITLKLNKKTIYESKKLRYLGLIVDNKLSWRYHIHELTKKLSRTNGILNKLKNLGLPNSTLLSIYSSLFQSHMSYGLCIWGQTCSNYLKKIESVQNKAVRIISGADWDAPCNPIYKKLGILKVKDLVNHKFASLMWDFDHNLLPNSFESFFNYAKNTHKYGTRFANANKLCENKKFNTNTYGINSFTFVGPKVLNSLKDTQLYQESKSKLLFLKKYKMQTIANY